MRPDSPTPIQETIPQKEQEIFNKAVGLFSAPDRARGLLKNHLTVMDGKLMLAPRNHEPIPLSDLVVALENKIKQAKSKTGTPDQLSVATLEAFLQGENLDDEGIMHMLSLVRRRQDDTLDDRSWEFPKRKSRARKIKIPEPNNPEELKKDSE